MSGQHAPLAPSSAPQWAYCSGSVQANFGQPDFDTQDSREGDAAHWVASECLTALRDTPQYRMAAEWIGQKAPNGVVIDSDMAEAVQVYIDDCMGTCQKIGGLKGMLIEQRVEMPDIHPQNWGTLDWAVYDEPNKTLYLSDYKHGHGDVSAFENMQLIDYLKGLFKLLGIDGLIEQTLTVAFRVVQPRCYSSPAVDEWRVLASDLRPYYNQLAAKAHEAFNNPSQTAGKHCRYCKAVGRCGTARKAKYSFMRYVNEPCVIDTMSGADLAIERKLLEEGMALGKGRLQAIEDDLMHRVKNGATDTGLALETAQGRQVWTVPPEQAVALCKQFGVDAAKPDVKTPTQVCAAAPLEVRNTLKEVLKTVTHRPTRGLKLIDAEDTIASRVFKRK